MERIEVTVAARTVAGVINLLVELERNGGEEALQRSEGAPAVLAVGHYGRDHRPVPAIVTECVLIHHRWMPDELPLLKRNRSGLRRAIRRSRLPGRMERER